MAANLKRYWSQSLTLLEKYARTDIRYALKGGGWLLAGTIVSSGLSLVNALAFGRLFSKDMYGTYQYILSVMDIFGIFAMSGIDTAITRATARGEEGSIFDGLRTKITWGLIGGVLSIGTGVYYLIHQNFILGYGFLIAGLFIPFWEAFGIYTNYLQGKKRFDLTTLYDNCLQFFIIAIPVSVLILTKNLLAVLTAYFLSTLFTRLILFLISLRRLPPNNTKNPSLVTYGKHLTVIGMLSNFSSNIDRILLFHLLGPAEVAIYSFAQSIPLRITGFTKIVNRIAFPKMANQDMTTLQQTLLRKILLLALPSLMVAILYILAAPLLFRILLPQYLESIKYTYVASILIVLQPFSLFATSLSAQGKSKPLYIQNVLSPIARIILFFVFIYSFGLMGAIISLILSRIFDTVVIYILFYRTR